jgi:hypothetical protein
VRVRVHRRQLCPIVRVDLGAHRWRHTPGTVGAGYSRVQRRDDRAHALWVDEPRTFSPYAGMASNWAAWSRR